MIGIGKWEATAKTIFFKARGTAEIRDNNGKYEIIFDIPEKYRNAKFRCYDIKEINENTLSAKGETSLLPNKVVKGIFTFNGDRMSGFVDLPIMGGLRIMITDGRRI